MPFDGMPTGRAADLAKLHLVRDGLASKGWATGRLGLGHGPHCVLGWLYFVTDGDADETTRLAVDYIYPALPTHAYRKSGMLRSIWEFNDNGSHDRVVALLDNAIQRAG